LIKIFNQIWEEREHFSELSGKPLFPKEHPKWHWQFMHILGKNNAPEWKFEKHNIILGTPEEHEKQESNPKFIEIREQKKREYNKWKYPERFK
jgi:hypothetical protein